MQQRNFNVLHRKGTLYYVPDALSRAYEDEEIIRVTSFVEDRGTARRVVYGDA